MLYADVKANVKQQEINYLVAVSYEVLQEVPSKLEIQCKKGMYFYLILIGIPSILIFSVKNRGRGEGGGRGEGVLNGQNLLCVTEVIC